MSTEERQESCEDRIDAEAGFTVARLREMIARCDSDDDEIRETALEELQDYGLSVEVKTSVRWVLGTGGPHNEIVYDVSPGKYGYDVDRTEYVFQDWFDGARKTMTDDDAAVLERAAEIVGILEPGVVLPEIER